MSRTQQLAPSLLCSLNLVSQRSRTRVAVLSLTVASFLLHGCGQSQNVAQPTDTVTQADPDADFKWGMERLERALRVSRPSTSDGIYTEREMSYEIIPPATSNDHYTATVTITSETEFIHGKRNIGKEKDTEPKDKAELKFDEPLSENSEEIEKLLDIPGVGPQAPITTAPPVETRSLESETLFEFAYLDNKWQLQTEPEHTYEKLWFEYAFPER